jgi:hypothetical protein
MEARDDFQLAARSHDPRESPRSPWSSPRRRPSRRTPRSAPLRRGRGPDRIAAVGAAASAYGTYAASEAASEAHTYNKKIAENQAVYAQQQADIAAQTEQEKNRHILAAQRAAYGSSGVTDEGSPLMVMADTARQMERDQYLIKYGGDVSASGYRAQAGLQGLYSRQSQQQGQVGAGVSLLSSASNIGGKYYYGRYGGSGSRD